MGDCWSRDDGVERSYVKNGKKRTKNRTPKRSCNREDLIFLLVTMKNPDQRKDWIHDNTLFVDSKQWFKSKLTLSLLVTRICVNYSNVYNDTLVAKGLKKKGITNCIKGSREIQVRRDQYQQNFTETVPQNIYIYIMLTVSHPPAR